MQLEVPDHSFANIVVMQLDIAVPTSVKAAICRGSQGRSRGEVTVGVVRTQYSRPGVLGEQSPRLGLRSKPCPGPPERSIGCRLPWLVPHRHDGSRRSQVGSSRWSQCRLAAAQCVRVRPFSPRWARSAVCASRPRGGWRSEVGRRGPSPQSGRFHIQSFVVEIHVVRYTSAIYVLLRERVALIPSVLLD